MKKNFLMAAAAASMLAFTACSNEEEVARGMEENGVQNFVLQVASAGDGLTTRAGRPLYAANAAQDIDDVDVIIYNTDNNEVVFRKSLNNWKGISHKYTNGLQHTFSLKGDDKLKAGSYKVLAVGRSAGSQYNYVPAFENLNKGAAYDAPIKATFAGDAEEVFAGELALSLDKDGKEFDASVVLHRQVAGGFGYFKNIPAAVNGKDAATLQLVTRTKNTTVAFENFNSDFKEAGAGAKYVVNGLDAAAPDAKFNGSVAVDGVVLYKITLSDWFEGLDTNGDGILNHLDNWRHPESVATALIKGSVFAGKFMIPFAQTEKASMELQLLAADGTILKSWGVKIPNSDINTNNALGVTDTSVSIFNVVRNHMYNLGVKMEHNPGGGTDPENPDPEPTDPENPDNKPEDLSKGQDIILQVNDNWEAIHNMELD